MAARADEGFPDSLLMSFYHQKCVRTAYFPNLHPGPTSCSVTGIFFSSKDLRASYLQHSLLIPQAWSGFSRHQSVKFHPSVQISTFQCKIGPPFSEFTTSPTRIPLVIGLNVRRNQPQSSNCGFKVRSRTDGQL